MLRSGKDERSIIRACGGSRQALSKGFSPPKSPANRSKVLFVAEIAERAKGMEIETPVAPGVLCGDAFWACSSTIAKVDGESRKESLGASRRAGGECFCLQTAL